MYEKILVPLDGSRLAELALPYAEEMAGKLGSEIILLSVADSSVAREYHQHQIYVEKIITETKHNAERYLEGSNRREVIVSTETVVGNPAEEIMNYAEQESVGLIIMVTHGASGIRRWALGNIADKVLQASRQPVALIRAKSPRDVCDRGILDRLLVMLDGSAESEAVLPYVEELATGLSAEITLLQVVDEQIDTVFADAEGYLEKICQRLAEKGIGAHCEVRAGAPATEGIKLADEIEADMVAMVTHGRSGAGFWKPGSVAEKVLKGGKTPVLLVRTR
ncbi:universal stress protein [Chloroflexota bacterium]